MKTPANLAEMAHEETGQWLDSDLLETWVVRRFNRLEQKIRNLESELEAKVRQNAQLMRERDAYRAAEEAQIALRQKMEADRDALAAHVERIKTEESRAYKGGLSMPGLLHDIIYESPTISLVRRDANKKAEALEEFAEGLPKFGHMGVEKALLIKSRALRRQAEAQQ